MDGRDVADLESWEVAACVGSVFQNPRTQFFNVDSTGEVAFSLESMAWPEERIRERTHDTIRQLGLEELADRSIFSLSGGEKQRIAYASSWAPHPANLVLDEPTSNLDEAAIAALRRYLLDAKAQGAAVLVAEHRLWWLADVADEVVVMEEGASRGASTARRFGAAVVGSARPGAGCALWPTSGRASGERRAMLREPQPLVRLRGVHASYGKREVLHGVDLDLREGEVAALVGANGAGKSTLCRTIVGLHRESAGTTTIDGEPAGPKQRLRACSMVFQDVNYQLFADSVRTEVSFGLTDAEAPDAARVDEVLDGLGLAAYAERHPATLSGGQKQRLAVAACIATGKRLLVFDEPTSGLDLGSMRTVAALVRRLADEGRAVLVVTHDLEFIGQACDKAVRVEAGRIAAEAVVEGDLQAVRELLAKG
ncbi:MAG: ABC transporter ATP-binding protein [Eggerthella lenta]